MAGAVEEVRELLLAFGRQQDPALLTDAVERVEAVLAAPGFAELDGAARAYALTLAAAATTLRSRTPGAPTDDLDRSIAWTGQAIDAWPPGDPNRPRAGSNLASALADRYERDGDAADLDAAIDRYRTAIPELRTAGDRVDVALHGLGVAYHDRARHHGGRVDDLDRAVTAFDEALRCPVPDPDDRAGYLNSLGLTLRAKGRALADPDLLRHSDATFREALAAAAPGGDTMGAAAVNLAATLQDRAEADNDAGLLREAIDIYRAAIPGLDGPRRVRATTNLATALVDLYRYARDRGALEDATRELRRSAADLPDEAARRVALSNLGGALHEMYGHTGRIAVLDEAITVQEQVLAPPAPRPAERTLNLGVSLLARFRRRRARTDLDRAVALFEEAARTSSSRIERASALNSQANALSLSYGGTGDRSEIDRCVALREQAVAAAPPGSLDIALYRANLGVDLLTRSERGDPDQDDDVARAIAVQRAAVREVPASAAEQPRLLAGLAESLARHATGSGDPGDVDEARATYRRVVELGRVSLPEQALGAALRWGDWESGRGCWPEAGAAYELGLTAMTRLLGVQDRRADKESWLVDALGLATAAAYAHVQVGDRAAAVVALEHGRAVLLADAVGRRRLRSGAPPP